MGYQSRVSLALHDILGCSEDRAPDYKLDPISAKEVLHLSQVVQQSEAGSFGGPSLGSREHYCGTCTPCDFVHRGGCRAGVDCNYCHLCTLQSARAYKKKRRKLERT